MLSAFAPAQHAVRFILGDTMAAIAPGLPGSESDQQLLNLVQETKWAPPVLLSIVDAE
ncbi:MAG: hypothetical protein ACRELY_16975 [Polyangiaceae bacterium]